jgi:hypothetical protein
MPEKLQKKQARQKKEQNSDTDRQRRIRTKKTLWLEGKTMTEESSVDSHSLRPGFHGSDVKSGPTITALDLSTC